MRILQVSSALQLGGGETHVLDLVEALKGRGHEVVVAGRRAGPLKPQIPLPFRNSADLFTAVRLRRALQSGSFDIIHAHVARDYPIVTAAALGLPVRVVLTRHLLYPVRVHALYRRVDGWIAPTSQILETLAPLRPRLSRVIPNWVNLDRFVHKPHPRHRPVNLGLLGQIAPHKGHDDAIAAMRKLGAGYQLLIAGKGEETYVQGLRRQSGEIPIQLMGFVSLPGFFDMVDILLVPSWEEPFGIVLLEAMASGVPVVSTAAGGPLDIIRPDVDGILVPPRNPEALAEAVRTLTDDVCRAEIVTHARERVEAEFDSRKVVPRIEDFYRTLLAED